MKRLLIFIFALSLSLSCAQNWNVFNKSYRYNYCFNNSSLVSNVLFAQAVTLTGSDTIYGLNLIGTPCIKGCPTLTATVGSGTFVIPKSRMIVPDQPQFLQRKIKKLSSGKVMLYDTTSMVIIPNCNLGQTWIFDSLNSITATCSSLTTKNIFSLLDSIKIITLSTSDSIILSKSFGLIQFPLPYSKNKYFRMVGVEKSGFYEQNSLYGVKVPNFWDFYNFNVGDEFYTTSNKCDNMGSPIFSPLSVSVSNYKIKVLNKQLNSNSITYTLQSTYQSNSLSNQTGCSIFPGPVTNTTYVTTYTNSGMYSDLANLMYPGMLCEATTAGNISPTIYPMGTFNIVNFLKDAKGNFTKKAGFYCAFSNPVLSDTAMGLKYDGGLKMLLPSNYFSSTFSMTTHDKNQKIFTSGQGTVRYEYEIFEHEFHYCLKSALVSTDSLFGPMPPWGFGVDVNEIQTRKISAIYPNPADNYLTINSDVQIEYLVIYNTIGQIILSRKNTDRLKLNTTTWEEGVYFIRVETDSGSNTQKIIIQH